MFNQKIAIAHVEQTKENVAEQGAVLGGSKKQAGRYQCS
jgi:hypothetical protein